MVSEFTINVIVVFISMSESLFRVGMMMLFVKVIVCIKWVVKGLLFIMFVFLYVGMMVFFF